MGTLDEAIREHLELKRRSGASDEEVARLEHEAFGPIRREAPAPGSEEAAAAAEDASPEEAESPEAEDLAASADEALPEIPPVVPPVDPFVAGPPMVPPPPAPAERTRSWLDDDDDDEEAEQKDGGAQQGGSAEHTAEFTAVEAADAEGRPPTDHVAPDDEGDDLLEETPDFLQETPEHDRLWFEQRPPRDFDFDE